MKNRALSFFSPGAFFSPPFYAGIGIYLLNSLAPAAPEVKSDIHGDALPEGASARLGTLRLRALFGSIHFSADGNTLVGVDAGRLIRVWDAADGQVKENRLLPGRPERSRWNIVSAFANSGQTMLIADGSSLEMWDLPTAKRLDLPLPREGVSFDRVALSGDSRLVLYTQWFQDQTIKKPKGGPAPFIGQKQKLILWDTAMGKAKLLTDNERRLVGSWRFHRMAGTGLLVVWHAGTRVWDATTGQSLWTEKYIAEMVTFTPDGAHLIGAPGGGQGEWRIWETATGQPSKNLRPPTAGYAWSFAISPDGNLLLIPTVTDYVLWDLQEGRIRQRWPGAYQAGRGVFAPDSQSVVTYDAILRRWDVDSGRLLYEDVSCPRVIRPPWSIFFYPRWQPSSASVGEDAIMRVWDVGHLETALSGNAGREQAHGLKRSASPDGSTLVGLDEGLIVRTLVAWPSCVLKKVLF